MSNFNRFNCESTSELAKREHCQENRDKAPTYELSWVSYIAGKRENRRLIGDYILTQNDIVNKTLFEDRVAYGAWVVDDHYSDGFFHKGLPGVHQDKQDKKGKDNACSGVEFSIPFRSLYSRNIDNLMMAGRNISATHLAMSDTRVMLTCSHNGTRGRHRSGHLHTEEFNPSRPLSKTHQGTSAAAS